MFLANYLLFDGNCADAFKFYEKLLGGKIDALLTHRGTPAEETVPEAWRDKILHAHMLIGTQSLMGSDAPPGYYAKPAGFHVSLSVDEPKEAERLFAALTERGTVQSPLGETFFAQRFGMCVDRFGIPWMVNCPKTA